MDSLPLTLISLYSDPVRETERHRYTRITQDKWQSCDEMKSMKVKKKVIKH